MTLASQAIDVLDAQKWKDTPAVKRLELLEQCQALLLKHADELGAADQKMKNDKMGEGEIFGLAESKMCTAGPMANALSAMIHLYEELVAHDEMLKPISVDKIKEGTFQIQVFPHTRLDKTFYSSQKGYIVVEDDTPKQANPMDKPVGIIGVLGAGNYSSSIEMLKAIFLEGCAVCHKPHTNNIETDKVWAKIFAPLIEHKCLSFLEKDPERALNTDKRLKALYFTGATSTANRIMAGTNIPLVAECGGNNPCIIIPGKWTAKEMQHQAQQIACLGKLNGGAVCGRPQTIVLSKQWAQKQEFIDALKLAIEKETIAAGSYYPGHEKVMEGFLEAHPDTIALKPENGKWKAGTFYLCEDVGEDGYAVKHEAFTQFFGIVQLDAPGDDDPVGFMKSATAFCNNKLLGSLGCMILVDETTKKANAQAVKDLLHNLHYGGIGLNAGPPLCFLSCYLTWGGYGEELGKNFCSGIGNFGNLFCYENCKKAIMEDSFVSTQDMIFLNRNMYDQMMNDVCHFYMKPTYGVLGKLVIDTIGSSLWNPHHPV